MATDRSHLGKRARGQEDEGSQFVPTVSSGGDKLFRCGSCDKSYSRVDHLSRHVRSHTQVGIISYLEQKFVCPLGISFADCIIAIRSDRLSVKYATRASRGRKS